MRIAPIILLVLLAAGCASDPQRAPTTRTSDAALNDPYGKWSNVDTNISGGNGASDVKKDSLQRDIDRFLLK